MALIESLPSQVKRIEAHNDPQLLTKAFELIPLSDIRLSTYKLLRTRQKEAVENNETIDEAVLYETFFLSELLKWFKNCFFRWFDKPNCKLCNVVCILVNAVRKNLDKNTDLIEVFQCEQCGRFEYFHRYNDSDVLLDTRTGRCHEHAQVFALICKSLKYDSRVIFDITDHIWTEVYSDLRKRWIHCDPSEGILDKPLLYERGWKKDLSYIIAIGDTGIQEVTWRYTTELSRSKHYRQPRFEEMLLKSITAYQNQVLSRCSPARKKYLLHRIIAELVELLVETPTVEESYDGRQSGSREWRLRRGEIGSELIQIGHSFNYSQPADEEERKRFGVWYCANEDVYLETNFKTGDKIKRGWASQTFSYKNIIRKEEYDWLKSYLAREINDEPGILKWRFTTWESGYSIVGVYILTNFFVCDSGEACCKVNTDHISLMFVNEPKYYFKNLKPSKHVVVEITLSGGSGVNAWQHAQVARQSMDEMQTVSFGVVLYLKRD